MWHRNVYMVVGVSCMDVLEVSLALWNFRIAIIIYWESCILFQATVEPGKSGFFSPGFLPWADFIYNSVI